MLEEVFFTCPYCWERVSVLVDLSVPEQEYVEDCEVCCNPMNLRIVAAKGGAVRIEATQAS